MNIEIKDIIAELKCLIAIKELNDEIEAFVKSASTWECPKDYIFKDENGNVIKATKIVLEKKKPNYPATYEECCKILEIDNSVYLTSDKEGHWNDYELGLNYLIEHLRKLLICRDAYWKIAGEEMGLGKPWEPDWEDEHQEKYIIGSWLGTIQCLEENFVSHPLAFPNEEILDAFYENFKEEIKICKELL